MDRRSFLSRSMIGSGALVAGATGLSAASAGCGAAAARPTLGVPESNELLARLDRGLTRIRDVPPGTIARGVPAGLHPELAENVAKLTLEAFVVADVTRSVPEDAVVPRPLAQRLHEELPVLHASAHTNHALLTRMDRGARSRLNRRMRERPEAPTEVAEWIDEHARQTGVGRESLLRLRRAATEIKIRVRRQSATAVIDDCTAKVGRVLEHAGPSLSMARSATTTAMLGAIWQQIDGVPQAGGGTGPMVASGPASGLGQPQSGPPRHGPPGSGQPPPRYLAGEPLRPAQHQWNERWASPGDEEVQIGAIMMPFGLISCGLMLFIGLGVLIAGVVQNEEWDGTPEHEVRRRQLLQQRGR